MRPEKILEMLSELAVLKYFPASSDGALTALARLVQQMCRSESEVAWLVNRMTSGLYAEWPGPKEMRACFCSKFRPKDGINAYSEVYLDGIPSESGRFELGAPNLKALPPGASVTADSHLSAAVAIAVNTVSIKSAHFSAPITAEEKEQVPDWLKRIDGGYL